MPASHKLKLTLLDTKFQKLTASKLTNGCEAILIANLIIISHSLVWEAYLTIYGNEASERQNNQRLATAYQCIGEYSL